MGKPVETTVMGVFKGVPFSVCFLIILKWTEAQYGGQKEGESCGSCFCPPTYSAGKCGRGLTCDLSIQDNIPDLPGTCRKIGSGGGYGCECTNPWLGQRYQEHKGDPGKTCPRFCYVDCRSDCRDKRQARGRGRCWSKVACQDIPEFGR
eukprot:TRINITY_DN2430_c0_g1_i2.p1 TRINITY_DN2430_c0_g1~~TRINITY_DN2430_c0_g1_i2.p1  ORF type:complete len:149 (-),score=38.80 TRINITY_DN2430_c0_g1_i2:226-672(-)